MTSTMWIEILLFSGIWFGFAAYVLWKFRGHERRVYLEQYRIWILVVGMLSIGTLRGEVPPSPLLTLLEIMGLWALVVLLWWTRPHKRKKGGDQTRGGAAPVE